MLHRRTLTLLLCANLALIAQAPPPPGAGPAEPAKPEKKPAMQPWQTNVSIFKAEVGQAVGAAGAAPDPKDRKSGTRAAAQAAAAKFSGKPVKWKLTCTGAGDKGPVLKELIDDGKPVDVNGAAVHVVIGQVSADKKAWNDVQPGDQVMCEANLTVDAIAQKTGWYVLGRISGVKVMVLPKTSVAPAPGAPTPAPPPGEPK